jgi:hypothetical protein
VTPAEWTAILSVLVAGGLLKWIKSRRDGRTPEARQATHVATVDQSLTVVARARDELEADNARLRAQGAEDRARYEADRARWELRETAMRNEIDALEAKIRALLTEVEKMKDRHTFDEVAHRRMYPGSTPPPAS